MDAAVRKGTDYVDINGEAPWVRRIIQQYHEAAEKAGVRIVPCCGFDSVPSDIGTLYLVNHVKNVLGK